MIVLYEVHINPGLTKRRLMVDFSKPPARISMPLGQDVQYFGQNRVWRYL